MQKKQYIFQLLVVVFSKKHMLSCLLKVFILLNSSSIAARPKKNNEDCQVYAKRLYLLIIKINKSVCARFSKCLKIGVLK